MCVHARMRRERGRGDWFLELEYSVICIYKFSEIMCHLGTVKYNMYLGLSRQHNSNWGTWTMWSLQRQPLLKKRGYLIMHHRMSEMFLPTTYLTSQFHAHQVAFWLYQERMCCGLEVSISVTVIFSIVTLIW